MKYKKRIILVEINNPCRDIEKTSSILLYSLVVSRGIRVDTILVTLTHDKMVLLEGKQLRHLYPQENSLKGFVKAVYCKEKRLPGVKYIEKDMGTLEKLITSECMRTIILRPWGKGQPVHPCELYPIFKNADCIVIDTCGKQLLPEESRQTIMLKGINENTVKAIAITHYIIDIACGALIRRKGEIVYARGLCGENKEQCS